MAKDITNQDIFNLLQEFMQMTSDRFDSLEERMGTLEKASREHTTAIKELTARVDKIDLVLTGVDDDIKYLYKLIEQLKKDLKRGLLSNEETRSRLEEVEAVARQLSQKYGLNYS